MPMLDTERRGRVLVVRIDHPPHNFMTAEMVRELHELVRSVNGDEEIGAVVITGKPDDLYITHYDVGEILASVKRAGIAAPPWLTGIILRIVGAARRVPGLRDLAARTPLAAVFELYRIHDLFLEMNRSDVVFIAAINGPATGGGCETSLACDIRLMADTDISIGLPEMTIDFNPGAGGTQRLPRAVGVGRAMQMMLQQGLQAFLACQVGGLQKLAQLMDLYLLVHLQKPFASLLHGLLGRIVDGCFQIVASGQVDHEFAGQCVV